MLSVHVGDIKDIALKSVAESRLYHLNESVGQCKADYGLFVHIDIQYAHSLDVVLTHQCVYVDSIQPIKSELYSGKDDETLCNGFCREACRSVLGVVAWAMLIRVDWPFVCRFCNGALMHRGLLIVKD